VVENAVLLMCAGDSLLDCGDMTAV